MNVIKNIHWVQDVLPASDLDKLEKGAALYKRHAGIQFKIFDVDRDTLVVQVIQNKHAAGKYLDQRELAERTKKLFGEVFRNWKINVRPTPFVQHPSQQVTPEWVRAQMDARGMKLKDLVETLGLEKSNVSAWTTGTRPMSNIVKSLMYHVLK